MVNIKEVEHYIELIQIELDKLKEAYDDESPDIETEIENLVSDLALNFDK